MLNGTNKSGSEAVFSGETAYVPPVATVVAPSVLAEVFQDGVLPFSTNADGSVDTSVYMAWLQETWAGGMAQFDAQSDDVVAEKGVLLEIAA
ncbi:hypothetical protein [Agrobacterium tumefaciens]|uniref:hypothetical protein n=1 Tax=Agrobacterium tumefaciens TaxID=358 RepID=UPI001571E932|nr:hypothetical protein [Agrobacterium tumefaciens]NTB05910.1 hypothetical protein [Agrobacterium tumefaciens]